MSWKAPSISESIRIRKNPSFTERNIYLHVYFVSNQSTSPSEMSVHKAAACYSLLEAYLLFFSLIGTRSFSKCSLACSLEVGDCHCLLLRVSTEKRLFFVPDTEKRRIRLIKYTKKRNTPEFEEIWLTETRNLGHVTHRQPFSFDYTIKCLCDVWASLLHYEPILSSY